MIGVCSILCIEEGLAFEASIMSKGVRSRACISSCHSRIVLRYSFDIALAVAIHHIGLSCLKEGKKEVPSQDGRCVTITWY